MPLGVALEAAKQNGRVKWWSGGHGGQATPYTGLEFYAGGHGRTQISTHLRLYGIAADMSGGHRFPEPDCLRTQADTWPGRHGLQAELQLLLFRGGATQCCTVESRLQVGSDVASTVAAEPRSLRGSVQSPRMHVASEMPIDDGVAVTCMAQP